MTAATGREIVRLPARSAAPTAIRTALRALWQDARSEGIDTAHAVTINFVAVGRTNPDEHSARDPLPTVADDLLRRSPGRAFLLQVDDRLAEPRVEVAAILRQRGDARFVIAEEILVEAPESWFEHLPGLVRPLLIHDLPTHVFWADDWRDEAQFQAIRELGEHCIVDSQRFTLPAVQLPALRQAGGSEGPITDLNWLRLRPWRRALAEAFQRIRWRSGAEVTGTVRHGASSPAAAILLAEWLQERLEARIELEECENDDCCPESVRLLFDGNSVEVHGSPSCLTMNASTEAECYLPLRLPRSRAADGELLGAAIDLV